MAEDTKPREVQFSFEYDKDYRLVPSNGAWVGGTTRRDITIDFFVDRLGLPEMVRYPVQEDGKFGHEMPIEMTFVRRVQIGVLMSLESADTFADFLKLKVEQMKKDRDKK
jgi:hypothetical protein